jgi:hypothetical protein
MIDESGFMPHGDTWLRVGCAVELTGGVLSGMTGVLVGFGRGDNCVIRLDGLERGVLAVIAAAALQKREVEPSISAASPVTALAPRPRRVGFDRTVV